MKYAYKINTLGKIIRSDGLVIEVTAQGAPSDELKEFWAWQSEKKRVGMIQQYLDDEARMAEFAGGIDSVGSFVNSEDANYAHQAQALLAWRDDVWAKFEEIRTQDLTLDQLKKRLPAPPQLFATQG